MLIFKKSAMAFSSIILVSGLEYFVTVLAIVLCLNCDAVEPVKIGVVYEASNQSSTVSKVQVDVGEGLQLPTPEPNCFVAAKTCPSKYVRFFLYTSLSPENPVELNVDDPESIRTANFVQGPIKCLIHGYTGDKDATPNIPIRPAYFQRPIAVNVISLDFGPLVRIGCYLHSVSNIPLVANCTAQILERILYLRPDINLSQIHVIGLSLGAQVAGQIAEFLKIGKLERITALDAALPFYPSALSNFMTIHKGQAKFMDALHTNAGLAGQFLPYADCDFYANGGTFQPGCAPLDLTCDHVSSARYYANTINSPTVYRAYPCRFTDSNNCIMSNNRSAVYYGEDVDHSARGKYFFSTTSTAPAL